MNMPNHGLNGRHMRWLEGTESAREVSTVCLEVLGVVVHPAAIAHLLNLASTEVVAYPRLEKHSNYLFGSFYLPSNVENPAADFDSIVFVATHDAVVATSHAHSTSVRNWEIDKARLFAVDLTDSTPDGGQFILNALRLVVHELITDYRPIVGYLDNELAALGGTVDMSTNISALEHGTVPTRKDRREIQRQVLELLPFVNGLKREIPVITRVARETGEILESLIGNDSDRDLQIDLSGNERELFSRDLEIYLIDILIDTRQLVAGLEELSTLVDTFFARARQINEQENVAAGRFTGAIASIMLLPTFIVGLYGQNFAEIPETDWQYGYLFSWGAIVLLTIFQVLFFRRRRWI